jgi:hypothetical protein
MDAVLVTIFDGGQAIRQKHEWYGASLGGSKNSKCEILRVFTISDFINI